MYTQWPKMCETKTKNKDFYFQFVLSEKPYAEWSETGNFLSLNYEK